MIDGHKLPSSSAMITVLWDLQTQNNKTDFIWPYTLTNYWLYKIYLTFVHILSIKIIIKRSNNKTTFQINNMFVCCKSTKTDSLKVKFYKTIQIMRLEANLFYSRQVLSMV